MWKIILLVLAVNALTGYVYEKVKMWIDERF